MAGPPAPGPPPAPPPTAPPFLSFSFFLLGNWELWLRPTPSGGGVGGGVGVAVCGGRTGLLFLAPRLAQGGEGGRGGAGGAF